MSLILAYFISHLIFSYKNIKKWIRNTNSKNKNYNLDLKVYELKDKFDLSYMGIYEVEDVNMYKEEIKEPIFSYRSIIE